MRYKRPASFHPSFTIVSAISRINYSFKQVIFSSSSLKQLILQPKVNQVENPIGGFKARLFFNEKVISN